MFMTSYLMSTIWLAAAFLCVCQGLPSEIHEQKRLGQVDDSALLSKGDIKPSTFHKHPSISHSHWPHHHPRHIHAHSNTTHSHSFKSHSSDSTRVNGTEHGKHFSYLATKGTTMFQVDDERDEEESAERRKENEERRRRKEDNKNKRKMRENLTWHNDVDDVLAALVGYSRDPTLWRFVHNVVAELDYSKQASNSNPSLRTHRSHHITEPQFSSWTTRRNDKRRKGKHAHHRPQLHPSETFDNGGTKAVYGEGGSGRHGEGSESEKRVNGSQTYKVTINMDGNISQQAFVPSLNQPVINKFAVLNPNKKDSQATKGTLETNNAVTSSLSSSAEFVARPTHGPHFIFHKVYIDTNYDPHTRQPYHRPVLAVKAVSWDKTKDPLSDPETTDSLPDIMEPDIYHLDNDGSTDLPDKLDELLIHQTHNSELEDGRNESRHTEDCQMCDTDDKSSFFEQNIPENLLKTDDKEQEDSYAGQGWREIKPLHRHQKDFLQRLRQLHSFKSQMRFLRRWQERLLRKRHHWSSYYLPTMT